MPPPFRKLPPFLAVLAALSALTAPTAHAEHPHYQHALSDLRAARFLLDRPPEYNFIRDQYRALDSVDHVIDEIDRADLEDVKQPRDHLPADSGLDRHGRLTLAQDMLADADRELHAEEDDTSSPAWRDAALRLLTEARSALDRAIRDNRLDPPKH